MKKILQKSLASMVSAALCLTAFVGCLTVNAETGTGTFTVKSQSAKPGASVIVPVEIMSDDASKGLAAAIFDVTFDSNVLTPTAIAAPSANLAYGVDYRTSNGNEIDVKVDTKTGLGTIRVLASLKDDKSAPVTTGMIANITFAVADTAALGVTAITLSNAQACNYGTADATGLKYDNDEDLIAMTTVDGTVTVESATTEPVLDENITCTLGAGLANTVFMSFKINKSALTGYSDFYLKVDRQTKDANWDLVDAESFYINKSDLGNDYLLETTDYYWFYYRGTELFSLSVPINAVLYCKDAEGNVVARSNKFSSSLSVLLKSLHANAKSKANTKLATAITDTLVAGDEAVKYFTKTKPDSGYAQLESPIAGFDTSDATSALGALNSVNVGYDGTGDAGFVLGAGVAESPFISAYLTNIPTGSSIESYSVEFSYFDKITNSTKYDTTVGSSMLPNASYTRYYSYFRSLPIYASDADVTIKVYKNGVELGCAHYSFEQFVSLKKDDANMGTVITALGKLGQSFRVLKGI